jgi:TRAP transporter TAXI family solute receptor
MKKIIAMILAGTMALTLVACGGGSAAPAASSEAPAASTEAAEPAAEAEAEPAAEGEALPTVEPQDLVMGTGSTGGTYFALGGAMANAMNNMLADTGLSVTVQSTGASVENMNLMHAGEMDLGIAMNNVAANAYEGTGAFEETGAITDVKAIGVVYNEVYQIVANANTGAKNVEDLKGLKIAIGPAGSGTLGLSQKVFAAAGLDPEKDIVPQSDSFGDAATKMQDGHIDAACNVLAVPASSIVEMTTSMKLAYINISDDILAQIQADAPYFTRKVIEAGTYPDQEEDCNTITCKAVLYCRGDLDDDTIYLITKAFYETGEEVAAAHATGKEIQLEGCLEGVTTPIHPGAARYFEEMGIEVPNNG